MPKSSGPGSLYGPNTPLVSRFLEQIRAWQPDDALVFRRAWFARLQAEGGSAVAERHADVTARTIRIAVAARRRAQHRAAGRAAAQVLAERGAAGQGITIVVAELAGMLVVYDLLDEGDLEFLNQTWRATTGHDVWFDETDAAMERWREPEPADDQTPTDGADAPEGESWRTLWQRD